MGCKHPMRCLHCGAKRPLPHLYFIPIHPRKSVQNFPLVAWCLCPMVWILECLEVSVFGIRDAWLAAFQGSMVTTVARRAWRHRSTCLSQWSWPQGTAGMRDRKEKAELAAVAAGDRQTQLQSWQVRCFIFCLIWIVSFPWTRNYQPNHLSPYLLFFHFQSSCKMLFQICASCTREIPQADLHLISMGQVACLRPFSTPA